MIAVKMSFVIFWDKEQIPPLNPWLRACDYKCSVIHCRKISLSPKKTC